MPGGVAPARDAQLQARTGTSVTSEVFKDVIGRFASGVAVGTSLDGARPVGTTASAVSSLSAEPPMLLVCMNRSSTTGAAIHHSGHFSVNVPGEEHGGLARHFAREDP